MDISLSNDDGNDSEVIETESQDLWPTKRRRGGEVLLPSRMVISPMPITPALGTLLNHPLCARARRQAAVDQQDKGAKDIAVIVVEAAMTVRPRRGRYEREGTTSSTT